MILMKKFVKKIVLTFGIIAVVCIIMMLICNQVVVNNAEGKAFSEIDSIKPTEVGLLLGTTPQARITKVKNYFFIYRLDAAKYIDSQSTPVFQALDEGKKVKVLPDPEFEAWMIKTSQHKVKLMKLLTQCVKEWNPTE